MASQQRQKGQRTFHFINSDPSSGVKPDTFSEIRSHVGKWVWDQMRKDDSEPEPRTRATDGKDGRDASSHQHRSSKDDSRRQISPSSVVASARASTSRLPKLGGETLTVHASTSDASEIDMMMDGGLDDGIGWERRAISLDRFKPSLTILGGVWDPFQ